MRKPLLAAGLLAATFTAAGAGFGVAHAQPSPASPPPMGMGAGPGGMGAARGPHHPPPGPHGMPWGQHGPAGMLGGMHPPKAAVFMFKRGDERIMIKCADDEPTKACVDGASTLIGKLAPSTAGTTGGATTQ